MVVSSGRPAHPGRKFREPAGAEFVLADLPAVDGVVVEVTGAGE